MKLWATGVAILASASLGLAGCAAYSDLPATSAAASEGALQVAVAFYPFEFVAERVGGELVTVDNLTTPGTEPHDLELTPQQVAALSTADLVVYQSGFQPAVDTAVEQARPPRSVDAASFLPLLAVDGDGDTGDADHAGDASTDPHTWLDPENLAQVAERVRDALSLARPDAAPQFAENTTRLLADLTGLDDRLTAQLSGCRISTFITSHAAFGYFAARYGLTQVGINGVEPDVEPSAARIAAVQRVARQNQVTTIFFETLASPVVAQAIAGDLGLDTDVLDPLEGITAESRGNDYLEVMAANGAALQKANQCS